MHIADIVCSSSVPTFFNISNTVMVIIFLFMSKRTGHSGTGVHERVAKASFFPLKTALTVRTDELVVRV
jgi:hypothetical protein